jgi:hypothetical protein
MTQADGAEAERERRRRDRLVAELRDEGVDLLGSGSGFIAMGDEPHGDQADLFDALVDELSYARRPLVHEGRRSSYGVIIPTDPGSVTAKLAKAGVGELIVLGGPDPASRSLAAARAYANGRTTFLVRSVLGAEALVELPAGDELALVRLVEDVGVYVIQRTAGGAVKAFVQGRLYVFEHDLWSVKPYAVTCLDELDYRVGLPNPNLAGPILDFCLHRLSARHIGATLVWLLDGTWVASHRYLADQGWSPEAALRLDEPGQLEALATLLAAVDGACLLEPDGTVARVKAKLGSSDTAVQLIAPEPGTRHTSAKRFSFDEPRAIAIVVSQDGPVTIYSDGRELLRLTSARPPVVLLGPRMSRPIKPTENLTTASCPRCKKRLAIEGLVFSRDSTAAVNCPICRAAVTSVPADLAFAEPIKPWADTPPAPAHGFPRTGQRGS